MKQTLKTSVATPVLEADDAVLPVEPVLAAEDAVLPVEPVAPVAPVAPVLAAEVTALPVARGANRNEPSRGHRTSRPATR